MPTDEALVAELAGGSERALAELLARHERGLARFIHRYTGGQDVEDVFQETWLRVVRHAHRFDPTQRFSTWLFQIALNLCRDRHRRRPRTPAPSLGEAPTTADQLTDTERAEARVDSARLLARLPQEQQEVLILHYYHDLSDAEVARIVGCPVGTVKSRMHHALARLAAAVRAEKP